MVIKSTQNSWNKKTVANCIQKTNSYTKSKIKKTNYKATGQFPIVDQGKSLVTGYTDDKSKLLDFGKPVIIFGDHTRIIKFIDFPFCLGADGTKILIPKEELDPQYFYYALQSIELDNRGYSRHYRYLKEKEISIAPLSIQKKLVIQINNFFRKHKLVQNESQTEAMLTETLLQTVISDFIDKFESTQKMKFNDIATVNGRIGWKGLKRDEYVSEGPNFLAVKNLGKYQIDFSDIYHITKERFDESPEIILQKDDVLLSKDGTIGRLGFVENIPSDTTVNSSIVVIRPRDKNKVLPKFLYRYFQSAKFQDLVASKKTGTCVPHLFQKDIKKFELAIPSVREQKKFIETVDNIEEKLKLLDLELEKMQYNIDVLPQAVLAQAFSGKLVA